MIQNILKINLIVNFWNTIRNGIIIPKPNNSNADEKIENMRKPINFIKPAKLKKIYKLL